MNTKATITLNVLRCIKESDRGGRSHSEPYVWPFMAILSNNDYATRPLTALYYETRNVLKSEMRAGQSAVLEGPSNRLTATYTPEQHVRHVILVVALWEQDDTPMNVMQEGHQAYLDALHTEIGHKQTALLEAYQTENQAWLQELIEEIRSAVYARVNAAIRAELSGFEKVQIRLGTLNIDDFMASGFAHFRVQPGPIIPFTVRFEGTAGDPKVVPTIVNGKLAYTFVPIPIHYELDCTFEVTNVQPCQEQLLAFDEAEASLHTLNNLAKTLRRQEAVLTAQIKQIDDQLIPVARRTLARARKALSFCETHGSMDLPNEELVG
jgi:hypothetical protein